MYNLSSIDLKSSRYIYNLNINKKGLYLYRPFAYQMYMYCTG